MNNYDNGQRGNILTFRTQRHYLDFDFTLYYCNVFFFSSMETGANPAQMIGGARPGEKNEKR